jgi:hypothetical protein
LRTSGECRTVPHPLTLNELPEGLGSLTNLTKLDLTGLPEEICSALGNAVVPQELCAP